MKPNACQLKIYTGLIVAIMFLLLACSVSKSGQSQLSAADQVATGVAATQQAQQGSTGPLIGQQTEQENPSTEQPALPAVPSQDESPTQPATPLSPEAGLSRSNPLPPGILVSVPNWDIQVLEYHRGEEALKRINESYTREIMVEEGFEIVLVKFFVRCTSFEDKAFDLGIYDLALTGSSYVLYGDKIDEWPQPEFYYKDMFTAEAVEGWLDTVVPVGEQNLMAVVDLDDWSSSMVWPPPRYVRFLALEPGSSIVLPIDSTNRSTNEIGMRQDNPAGIGQLVSMPEWDLTVLEILDSPQADTILQQNNNRYKAPEAGYTYSLWHIKLQYFGEQDWPMSISGTNFFAADSSGNRLLSDSARYVQNPDRNYLSETVLPGAELDGWVILQVPEVGDQYWIRFYYSSYSTSNLNNSRYFKIN